MFAASPLEALFERAIFVDFDDVMKRIEVDGAPCELLDVVTLPLP